MARSTRRLLIEQKAAQLGLDFNDSTSEEVLLKVIRKSKPDFLEWFDKLSTVERLNHKIRVSLTCHNPERLERKSEQIFLLVDGHTIGYTMFYDLMADSWHFPIPFLDFLLGMQFAYYEQTSALSANGTRSPNVRGMPVFKGMKYDFSARLLPSITEDELKRIYARQNAQQALTSTMEF